LRRPQVQQAALDRVGRLRRLLVEVDRHEQRQALEVGPPARGVARSLVDVEEVVVEVEDPDVPVGHEVKLGRQRVRMGVRAQQRVVHGVELRLVPDLRRGVLLGRVEDPHLA
jgi:hypothetical protein